MPNQQAPWHPCTDAIVPIMAGLDAVLALGVEKPETLPSGMEALGLRLDLILDKPGIQGLVKQSAGRLEMLRRWLQYSTMNDVAIEIVERLTALRSQLRRWERMAQDWEFPTLGPDYQEIARTTSALRDYLDQLRAMLQSKLEKSGRTRSDAPNSVLNQENRTIRIQDKIIALADDQFRVVSRLIEAKGGWKPSSDLGQIPNSSERIDRIVKRLPSPLPSLIMRKPGTGYRIDPTNLT